MNTFANHEEAATDNEVLLRDELIPELADRLCQTGNGFELDHPLVGEFPVTPDQVTYLNELFQSKEASALQALKDCDWSGYIELHERPHRFDAFLEVMHELDDESYWDLLAHFWIGTENAWQNQSGWKDLWNSARSQKKFAMGVEERNALELMPDEFTIYRGGAGAELAGGLSWTLNREKAIWYARRHQGHVLLTAAVKKHNVHALLTRRGEHEIVVETVSIVRQETLRVEGANI